MKSSRAPSLARLAAAAALALIAGAARGQSYGPDDQALTVGVAEFTGFAADIHSDGYLYGSDASYRATVRIPTGALIERLCLYAHTSVSHTLSAKLVEDKLVLAGGGGPAELVVPGSTVESAAADGYGVFCTDAFAFTVPGATDVDGDGGADSVQFVVHVTVPAGVGFGAVKITWRRQVSPQPATATFDDVPLDNPYSPFIEALRASDVTGGCQASPPLYCPDRPITRAEMAVFVAKALGLHWAD